MTGREIRAPRGGDLSCRSWPQEAAMRMLMNNLDPEVAERPQDLVVYGGTGKAARSWEAFDAIVRTLRTLADDETLLVQSGKPVAVFRTHDMAPSSADLELDARAQVGRLGDVPGARGAGAHDVRPDDGGVVDLHRHPGHPAGHVRDARRVRPPALRRVARRHRDAHGRARRHGWRAAARGDDERRCCALRRGRSRSHRAPRSTTRYLDRRDRRPRRSAAVGRRGQGRARRRCRSASSATAPRWCPSSSPAAGSPTSSPTRRAPTIRSAATCRRGSRSPRRLSCATRTPASTCAVPRHRWPLTSRRSWASRPRSGRVRLRQQPARRRGSRRARARRRVQLPGVRAGVRAAAVLRGQGSVPVGGALGRPGRHRRDRRRGGRAVPRRTSGCNGGCASRPRGWRSRGCRRASAGSATASATAPGRGSTSSSRAGAVSAPIVIGRDHLDAGSVASPNRETEAMLDGSDAIADWPILNALVNTAAGAHWVSVHHGGGVGIGYSIHAGMVVVADGTANAGERLERVLTSDPGMGVVRHVDAGYDRAIEVAARARSAHADAGGRVSEFDTSWRWAGGSGRRTRSTGSSSTSRARPGPRCCTVPTAVGRRRSGGRRVLPVVPGALVRAERSRAVRSHGAGSALVRADPGRRARGRRQHAEHAGDLARARPRRDPSGSLGRRRRARRRQRRARTAGSRRRPPTRTCSGGPTRSPTGSGSCREASVRTSTPSRRGARSIHRLVGEGALPPGIACDDLAAVHFVGTEVAEVLVVRSGRRRSAGRAG